VNHKLTKAQHDVLRKMAEGWVLTMHLYTERCVMTKSYQPSKRVRAQTVIPLHRGGYLEYMPGTYDSAQLDRICMLTESGLSAAKEHA